MRTHSIALTLAACSFAVTQASAQDSTAPSAVLDAAPAATYGGVVLLSGSRSNDPGGSIVQYSWTHIEGTGGGMPLNQAVVTELAAYVVPQPAGDPLRPGRHRFRLTVRDVSGNASQPVDVQVIVVDNIPPVAVFGALSQVYQGAPLTLSGQHSADIGGQVVRYHWTRLQGGGGAGMPLNQPIETTTSSLTVPQATGQLAAGQHVFRLVVMDDSGNVSQPRDLAVNVIGTADTTAPTAMLDAPNSIALGAPLQLSGARSSDIGGSIVRYVWTRLEGSGGAQMPLNQPLVTEASALTVPQPAGAPLPIGRQRFRLIVTDNSGNESQPVERLVIVLDNVAPTAVIDAPGTVVQGQAFQLSGARSFDNSRIASYRWTRISGSSQGPMGIGQILVTDIPTFNVSQSAANAYGPGRQVFRLVVVDDSANQSQPVDFGVNVTAPL